MKKSHIMPVKLVIVLLVVAYSQEFAEEKAKRS